MKYSSLNEFAYSEIKKKLMENKILPNQRIREDILAEELEISRTPVREAINRLITEGLIVSVPRKGLFAKEITNRDIEEMIEVRVVLEKLSVSLCCGIIKEEQMDELEMIFQRYERMLRSGRYLEAGELDGEIHNYIAGISDNDRLIYYIKDIQQRFVYARARNVKWTEEMVERSIRFHRNLLDAIMKKDTAGSQKAVEEDIRGMILLLP